MSERGVSDACAPNKIDDTAVSVIRRNSGLLARGVSSLASYSHGVQEGARPWPCFCVVHAGLDGWQDRAYYAFASYAPGSRTGQEACARYMAI